MGFNSRKLNPELPCLLVVAVFCCTHLASLAVAQNKPQSISVVTSTVLEEVSEKLKKEPSISLRELAAFANELVAKRGFDYYFDVCDIIPKVKRNQPLTAEAFEQPHTLILANGRKQVFRFLIPYPGDGLCGECWSYVPIVHITKKEMTLVSAGTQYRIRRPKSFMLDEAELVDETRKRVLRTWQMPFQTIPSGISPDGSKLYLESYDQHAVEGLLLELSESGDLKFRSREEVQLQGEGERLEHPEDPRNAYLSFMRFKVGNKSYIIRFSAPCT